MGNLAELLGATSNTSDDPIEKAKRLREQELYEQKRQQSLAIANRIFQKVDDELQKAVFPYSSWHKQHEYMVMDIPNHHRIEGFLEYGSPSFRVMVKQTRQLRKCFGLVKGEKVIEYKNVRSFSNLADAMIRAEIK